MDFRFIVCGIEGIFLIVFLFYFANIISNYLTIKNKLRALEIDNKKYELFMNIDTKATEDEINSLIENYLNRYVLENFIINGEDFIRKDDIEIMIRELDKQIIVELSDLYIFYIKILIDVKNEDDIIAYIHRKTKDIVLNFVTEFNKEKE